MLISWIVTLDSHRPGSTIAPLVMMPDCFTASLTWLPVAFLTFTSGPLLHDARTLAPAIKIILFFMKPPTFGDPTIRNGGPLH